MKALRAAVAMAAVLAVSSAWAAADNAKHRSGGGGGGSSSAGGHHSGSDSGGSKGSSSSKSSSGSSSSSSSASDSSSSRRTPTGAQLRHPRAGTGTGFFDRRYRGGRYGYYGYGYNPYWYGFGYSWYSPFYSGGYYGGDYGGNYGGYDPYYQPRRYGYSSYRAGAVRVLVEPSETRVYVDGYYAGIADDFDGIFQRLNLSPGRHDISLKLEGYRTHNVKLYVPYDGTIKLHHRMVRGSGEEDAGVVGRPEDYSRYEERGDRDEARDEDARDARDDRDPRSDQAGDRALVRLDVRPGDASVYIDGAFRGTGRELRQLRLTAGRHRIEVVRPGYRTIDREVDVRSGETLDVEIDLDHS